MAITRYAGDRFTVASTDTKPTGVMPGAFLIDSGNQTSYVKTGYTIDPWAQIAGGGGGGSPGGSDTQVQFNNNGSFGGDADLTFTNSNQLNVNKLSIAGNVIDSNSSIGNNGMVLTNEGTTGVHWKNIESVLSGVGGSGVANYAARWSDEDTLTSGIIYDNGSLVGIGTTGTAGGKFQVHDGNIVITQSAASYHYYVALKGPIASFLGGSRFFDAYSYNSAGTADIARTWFTHGTEGTFSIAHVDTGTPSARLSIKTDGNVGIGTTNPGGKLEVDGSSVTVPLLVKAGTGANSIKFVGRSTDHISSLDFFQNNGSSGGAFFQSNGTWMRARADGGVHFRNGNTPATTSSDFTINGMSLGIGTSAPGIFTGFSNAGNYLTIFDTVAATVELARGSNNNNYAVGRVQFVNTNNADGANADADSKGIAYISAHVETTDSNAGDDSGGYLRFATKPEAGSAAEQMRIQGDGNVGINTLLPEHKLHVAGDAIVSGKFYDQTNSTGDKGYVLSSDDNGPLWKASGDFDGLSGNLITTGQTLQTQITSNDTDIATNVTNIATNVTNLITTGQYLTDEIDTVSGLIPSVVIDGAGVSGYTARWFDGNTLTSGTIYDDGNVGIGTIAPAAKLDVTHDGAWARLGYDSYATFQFYRNLPASSTSLPVMIVRQTHPDDDQTALIVDQDGYGNILELIEDSTTRVVVKADGKVGIGTTNPDAELQVMNNDSSSYRFGYGGTSDVYFDADDVYFRSDNGGVNQITKKGGSLGIGVVNAEHKLHVAGDAIISGYLYDSTNSTGVDGYVLTSREDGPQWDYIEDILSGVGGNGTANYVPKWEDSDTIKNSIIYDDGTNVGISTVTPSGKFHVYGGAGRFDVTNAATKDHHLTVSEGNATDWRPYAGSTTAALQLQSLENLTGDARGILLAVKSEGNPELTTSEGLDINVNATVGTNNGTLAVKVQSDGNVGIGTTNPGGRLETYVTAGGQFGLRLNSNFGGGNAVDFKPYISSVSNAGFSIDLATSTKFVINSDGNVGVGTNDPLWKFQVDGPAFVSGTVLIPNSSNYYGAYNAAGTDYIKALYVDTNDDVIVNHTNFQGNTIIRGDTLDVQPYDPLNVARSTLIVTGAGVGVPGSVGIGITTKLPQHTLHVSGDMQVSGYFYDSTSSTGVDGYVLTSKEDGPQWKMIEDVLSGVGGNGTANYVPRWVDSDTIGDSVIAQSGSAIGIGTAAPAEILEIVSDSDPTILIRPVTVDSANSGKISYRENAGGTTGVDLRYDGANNRFSIDTSDVANAFVVKRTDGKVGIGVAAPVAKVHIDDSATGDNKALYIQNTHNTDGDSAAIRFGFAGNDNANKGGIFFQRTANYGRGSLIFATENTQTNDNVDASDTKLIILADGKVGIGTTNPTNQFQIGDSVAAVGTGNHIAFSNGTKACAFFQSNTFTNIYTSIAYKFWVSGTEAITIDSSRNVGIGTASPTTLTELYQGSTTNPTELQITNFSAGDAFINFIERDATGNTNGTKFGEANAWGFQVGYDGGDNKFFIKSGNQETVVNRLTIQRDDGKVGIGTDDFTAGGKLQVYNGIVMLNQSAASNYYLIHLKGPVASFLGGSRFFDAHSYNAAGNAEVARTWFTHGSEGVFGIAHSASGTPAIRLVIATDGKVGIGITNPSAKLFTMGDSSSRAFHVVSSSAANATGYFYTNMVHTGTDTSATVSIRSDHASSTGQVLHVRGDGSGNLLTLDQGGTNRVVVEAGGDVGIGIDAPASALHVKASSDSNAVSGITIERSANTQKGYINMGGGAFNFNVDSGLPIKFRDGGAANVTILGDGNVGIGIEAPAAALDIELTGTEADPTVMMGYSTGSRANYRMAFYTDSETGYISNKNGDNGIRFRHREETVMQVGKSATEQFVGIGTTVPDSLLHVEGASGSSGGFISLTSTANLTVADSYMGRLSFGQQTDKRLADICGFAEGTSSDAGALVFRTEASGAGLSEKVRIKGDGNVGIGTTNPGSYKLKVEGTTWLNDVTFIAGNNTAPPTTSNSQDFGAIRMSDGALRSMYQGCTATYGWIQVSKSTDHSVNYPLALNPNGGDVGIGIATPGAKLDVAGVSRIQSTGPVLRFYDTDHDTHSLQMDLSGGNFRFYKYTGSTDASHSEIFRVTTAGVVRFNNVYSFPSVDGTAGYHLETDGAGAVTWQPGGSGTVTGTGTANYFSKWTGTSSQGNSQIFDNGTNVGIATATPVGLLDIIRVSNTAPAFRIGSSNLYGWGFFSRASTGDLSIERDNNTTYSPTLYMKRADGNVGIGTTNPTKLFHVNGASLLGGTTTVGGNLMPAITTLMDIGTSSVKWRNLSLSGTADIDGALTGTSATFSGAVYNSSGTVGAPSISFTGDTDTGIWRPGSNQLWFVTTGVNRIKIDGSGNTEITGALTGTTATFSGDVKAAQFYTNYDWTSRSGGINIGNNGLTTGAVSFYDGVVASSASIYRDGESVFFVGARGGTNTAGIAIATDGNVGIGTTTPGSYKLKVEGTTWLNDQAFIAGNNTAPPTTSNSQDFGAIRMSDGGLRSMYQGCTATYGWIQVMSSTNHATNYPLYLNPNGGAISFNGAYTFPTADGTAGYHLETDGAGAVTWQPGGSGTVTGTGTANSISKWTGTSSQGNSTISDNGSIVTVANDFHVYKAGSDKKLWLSEGTSGSGLTNVQLNPNGDSYLKGGDVGIGVAAPGARLHVVQTGSDEAFRIDGASGGFAMIVKGGSTYNTMIRGGVTIGNTFAASAPPSNGLISQGYVGIGTTNPTSLFHVNGASLLGGTTTVGGNLMPAITTLMDIGTSSVKWRNLSLSGTADIDSTLTVGGGENITGRLVFTDGVSGGTAPSSGKHLELFYYDTNDEGYIQAYDRDANAYLNIRYAALTHVFTGNATVSGYLQATGNISTSGTGTITSASSLIAGGTLYVGENIRHTGDTNNYINFTTDTQKFFTDNVLALTIDSSQNVGIGTTNPSGYKLKVEGTTWLNDQVFIAGNNTAPPTTSNSQDFGAIRMSDGQTRSMYQGCTATYGWIQVMSSTNHATNYPLALNPNGGNVGIGVTNPSSEFYVNGRTQLDGDLDFVTMGDYITFYGDSSQKHSISSRNNSGNAADDIRINSYGAVYINLDSNDNNTSAANFEIGRHGSTGAITDWLLNLYGETGKLKLNTYGSGTHTGTLAKSLGVDSSGNVIEFTGGTGTVTGTGTANYISKWTGTSSQGNSLIQDDGSTVGIGTNGSSGGKLQVYGGSIMIDQSGASSKYIVFQKGPIASFLGGSPFFDAYSYNAAGSADIARTWFTHSAEGTFSISHINTGTPAMALSIDTSANVGIGTTAPSQLLSVNGTFGIEDATISYSSGQNRLEVDKDLKLERSTGTSIYMRRTTADTVSLLGKIEFGNNNIDSNVAIISAYQGGATDAGELRFETEATGGSIATRMTIKSDGKVGIGTTNPGSLLDVNGTANIVGALTGAGATFSGNLTVGPSNNSKIYMGGNDYIGFTDAVGDGFKFVYDNSEKLRITNVGKVGIGTTVPGAKLHVYGGNIRISSTDDKPQLEFFETAAARWVIGHSNSPNNYFAISEGSDIAASERLVIAPTTGSVGIGTIAPDKLLHLSSSEGTAVMRFSDTRTAMSTGDIGLIEFETFDTGSPGVGGYILGEAGGTGGQVDLAFAAGLGGSATEVMRIVSEGKVGIGTTAPSAALDVVTSSTVWAAEINQTNTSNGDGLYVNTGSTASADYVASFRANNVNVLAVKANGSVGIGTATPGRKLDVDGRVLADTYGFRSDSTLKWYYFDNYSGSNFIGRGGNAYTALYDTGTQSMVWKNGKVGIGTTNPGATLDVNGSAIVRGILHFDSTASSFIDNASSKIKIAGDAGVGLWTYVGGWKERLTVLDDGKVGIGTTAPTKLLHVRAPANSTGGVIALLQSHDTANGWLQIQGNAGNSWEIGATDSGFQFYDDETAAYRVTIKNNGDVGIGVASLKTWYGGITQLALGSNRGTVVANASYIGVTENAYLNASAAWKKVAAGGASNVWQDDGTIYFRTTATGGSADDAITWNTCAMDSSGEFGIGTSSPAQKLHVVGDAVKFERTNNAIALQLYNTNASPADGTPLGYLQFMGKDNDGTANIVHSEVRGGVQSNSNTAVNGYLAFLTTNNGTSVTEHMRIKADGTLNLISAKLLINGGGGTAGYHLQTDGSGNISWQAGGSGTVTGTGTDNYVPRWNGTTALQNSALFSNDSGSVGIGTVTPGQRLDVINGAIRVSATGETKIFFRETVATDTYADRWTIGNDDAINNAFVFSTGATFASPKLIIQEDGKVGIGTTNPGSFQTWINAPAYFDDVVWTANAGGLGSYDTGGTLKSILVLNSSDELVVNHNAGGTIPTRVKGDYITFEPSDSVLNAPIETMRIVGGIGVGAKGCVGIGTNAPVATLEVAGTGLASGQAASKGVVKINANSVGGAIHYDTYATLTSYNVENRFQLIAQDVGSDAGFFTLTSTPATGTGANKHWIMGHRGPAMSNEFQIGYKTSTASGNISTTTLEQARLRIETSGRVIVSDAGGVANGVFGEYTKLVVDTTEANAQLLATDTGSWGASFIMTNAPASGNNRHWWFHHCPATHGTTANSLIIRYAATNTAANIGGDGTGTTPVEFKTDGTVLFNAGSVGIGTTAPGSYKLRVEGDSIATGDTYIYNNKALNVLDSGGQRSLMITNHSSGSNSPYFSADPDNQAANTKMYWYIDAAEKMSLDSGGNLSIQGTLTEASSIAIKENVETYSPSLEKISKMRPVRFNKKKSKKKEVGLVAEELAEMFPELVETDEKGNPSGVNYSRAVAVLLHGFKELYKEVKELKEKI